MREKSELAEQAEALRQQAIAERGPLPRGRRELRAHLAKSNVLYTPTKDPKLQALHAREVEKMREEREALTQMVDPALLQARRTDVAAEVELRRQRNERKRLRRARAGR